MKIFLAIALGTMSLSTTSLSFAENGNMMSGGAWNDGWMGGYDGILAPTLLVILVVGLVLWVVRQKG